MPAYACCGAGPKKKSFHNGAFDRDEPQCLNHNRSKKSLRSLGREEGNNAIRPRSIAGSMSYQVAINRAYVADKTARGRR